ncbi:MAG: lysine--tRNA ligase, partial [Candidatus Nanoarchaeia archaeon]
PIYGGANARPFETHHNALDVPLYMKISPELYLKRLIIGGFEKVYDLNRNFRNEGVDTTHNPEFTMMEFYQAFIDYEEIMNMTEQLYEHVANSVFGTTRFKWGKHEIDVKAPWKRITMVDALKEHAKIDPKKLSDDELKDFLNGYNIEFECDFSRGMAIQLLFEELCEDKMIEPIFVIDHPLESTPLCKQLRGDSAFVERLEPYICGMEVGNGYSELNDPILQRKRLEVQAEQLRAGASEAHPMDEDFIEAIEYGMPPTGGMGISIDRMVMVMTGSISIRDVILFPTMKPDCRTVEEQEAALNAELKASLK